MPPRPRLLPGAEASIDLLSRARTPIDLLRRADKHALASGDGLIFAPPHPLWLDAPGFWDGVQYFQHRIAPAFTVTLVDEHGREHRLRRIEREWTPAALTALYEAAPLRLHERRFLLPDGRAAADYTVTNTEAAGNGSCVGLVLWAAFEGGDVVDRRGVCTTTDGVHVRCIARDVQGRACDLPLDLRLAFGNRVPESDTSHAIIESQHGRAYPNLPSWDVTPFPEHWSGTRLDGTRVIASDAPRGRTLLFVALARAFDLAPCESARATAVLELMPVDERYRFHTTDGPPSLAAAAPSRHAPRGDGAATVSAERSERLWREYFAGAPALASSAAHIERTFAYRWYGLRFNFLGQAGQYAIPTCAEGPDFFHAAISYSAWCHARELRWLHDPTRARGVIRTFLQHQREDGSLPGIIYLDDVHEAASYFADWGGSVEAVDEVHPDDGFLAEVYPALCGYARHLDATRDPEDSGLLAVLDPYETGQEQMSRYDAVTPDADVFHFDYGLHLLGVDLTVYTYRLRRALARVAARLGRGGDVAAHDTRADRIGEAVRACMWDSESGIFSDVDPRTGRRTGVRAAVCFYPYMTDIAGPEHLAGLRQHLFDTSEFWLPYPVPSTAANDPKFSAAAEWRGLRRNCAWNGRVWPMTNAHVIDALANACVLDPALRAPAAELIMRTIRMLCFDGDAARPNSFEHYSPLTGRPCVHRGIDDYQHSWINDLIVRHVAGFRPVSDGRFTVDPLPCGVERVVLEHLPYRGESVSIRIEGDDVFVAFRGARHTGRLGEPLVVRG